VCEKNVCLISVMYGITFVIFFVYLYLGIKNVNKLHFNKFNLFSIETQSVELISSFSINKNSENIPFLLRFLFLLSGIYWSLEDRISSTFSRLFIQCHQHPNTHFNPLCILSLIKKWGHNVISFAYPVSD